MPNWCQNRLTIIGPAEDVARLVKQARGPTQSWPNDRHARLQNPNNEPPVVEDFSFHALVPLPAAALEGDYDPLGYEAERLFWGVKWGGSDTKLVSHRCGEAIYSFKTPWAPPEKLLRTLAGIVWPTLRFMLSFSEEYPSRGRIVVQGAELITSMFHGPPSHLKRPLESSMEAEDAEYDRWGETLKAWQDELVETHDAWVTKGAPLNG